MELATILLIGIFVVLIFILFFAMKIVSKIELLAATTKPQPPPPPPHISELVVEQPGKEVLKISVRQDFPLPENINH